MVRLILALLLISSAAEAGSFHKLRFSRTDGSVWECLTVHSSPETPVQVGQQAPGYAIGSHTCVYPAFGNSYTVDANLNAVIKNGQVATPIFWPGSALDVYMLFGFCIDLAGQGWLVTTDALDDNLELLFKLNIETGEVTFVDYVDLFGNNWFRVNGCVMIEFGG